MNFSQDQINEYNLQGKIVLQMMLPMGSCEGCVFDGFDLGNTHLESCDFKSASFVKADLTEAFLSGVNFDNAVLVGTKLMRTDLQRTNFKNANLHLAYLMGANLRGSNLENADLTDAILLGADLHVTNFAGAFFSPRTVWPEGFDPIKAGAIKCISQVDFQEIVDLHGKFLKGEPTGVRANLAGLYLQKELRIEYISLRFAKLTNVDFSDRRIYGVDFQGADFNKANLRRIKMFSSNLKACDLADVDMSEGQFFDTHFEGANLKNAILSNSRFNRMNFKGATYNQNTIWPDWFDPSEAGIKFEN